MTFSSYKNKTSFNVSTRKCVLCLVLPPIIFNSELLLSTNQRRLVPAHENVCLGRIFLMLNSKAFLAEEDIRLI